MELFKKNDITISTISEEDTGKVLEYFSENDFNCDYESGSLRPTNSQFMCIMKDIISGKDDESNIFVLKKHNEVIGYISMFVEYNRLNIGHIAVKMSERSKGYGKMLVQLAINIAEGDGRDVALFCLHPNSLFKKMNFETSDDVHYLHKHKKFLKPFHKYPKLFVDQETYKARKQEEQRQEVEGFSKFLNSGILDIINEIDINNYHM